MQLQLYMWKGARRIFLDAQRPYVKQLKTRPLALFTDDQFDEFAAAIPDLWSAMPERLYHNVTK